MKSENNSLQFTINPATVYISANPDQSSYANITVTVENTSTEEVQVNTIAITLPPALASANSLNSITPVAGDPTAWSFAPSNINTGEFDATAQNGDYVDIEPGDSYDFTLQMVTLVSIITQSQADVTASVTFEDGSNGPTEQLNVNIAGAVASIISFNSQPANIYPNETATLNWQCEKIDYCVISPIDESHRAASGTLEVHPDDTTIYTLYAFGDGVILSAQWAISVENASIILFGGAGGQTSINCGDMLTLVWECNQFTQSILLVDDTGVTIPPLNTNGNTPQKGSVSVGPIVTPTRFTFTAFGNNTQNFDQRDSTIDVNDVSATFSASPDSDIWEKDKVTLSWNITSATSVSVTPALDNGPSLQNLIGSTDIYPATDVTYTLSVNGFISNVPNHIDVPVQLFNIQQVAINSFTITPNAITPDNGPNSATLAWNCQAQVASIDNGIGTVTPVNSTPLNAPANGTVYNLTAGTIQNPDIISQAVTVVNAYGPYTFTNFTPDITILPALDLIVSNPGPMNNLKQGLNGGYEAILTGVVAIGTPPASYAAVAMYQAGYQDQSYFVLMSWPYVTTRVSLQWANPDDQSGTITLAPLSSDLSIDMVEMINK